ncbi:MAG: hypothetical protein M1541_08840, partial [Acidobacteria bacterium]|nr:hypothetical protein [Acidobacteriota bacterium]
NANLFQRLVVQFTGVPAWHSSLYQRLLTYGLINIVVPEPKIIFGFVGFGFATEAWCSLYGFPTLQTFAMTLLGAGIPPLRISAPGIPMPSPSRSSGGMCLVPETNSQKLSEPGLYYKTFAGTKPAPRKGVWVMPDTAVTTSEPAWAAFVALDWGSQKHAWVLQPADGGKQDRGYVDNTPEAIAVWAAALRHRFGGLGWTTVAGFSKLSEKTS